MRVHRIAGAHGLMVLFNIQALKRFCYQSEYISVHDKQDRIRASVCVWDINSIDNGAIPFYGLL